MLGWMSKREMRQMPETSDATAGGMAKTRGLLAGTKVATAMGWRSVEALEAGDHVLTFDNGLLPLESVCRDVFWVADAMEPARFASYLVPAQALGNATACELLADQGVLVESDAACDAQGDPFAVLPAKALDGFRGIQKIAPRTRIEVVSLTFATEEVIYADGGVLVHCPRAHVPLTELSQRPPYDMLTAKRAAAVVDSMRAEDRVHSAA